jgi:hypothetical protein
MDVWESIYVGDGMKLAGYLKMMWATVGCMWMRSSELPVLRCIAVALKTSLSVIVVFISPPSLFHCAFIPAFCYFSLCAEGWLLLWHTVFVQTGLESVLGVRSNFIRVTRPGTLTTFTGRAVAQVVSRRPHIMGARIRVRVIPNYICTGQSGTGTVSLPVLRFFPVTVIPPGYRAQYIILGMNKRPVGGRSLERQSHPIDKNKKLQWKLRC